MDSVKNALLPILNAAYARRENESVLNALVDGTESHLECYGFDDPSGTNTYVME